MTLLKPDSPVDEERRPAWAPFALAFRPLFLLAGLSAVGLMVIWLAWLRGGLALNGYYPGTTWHAHEMLFGYTAAAAAGFLLTAVRNWTGVQTIHHAPLAGLALTWLLARVLPFVPAVPPLWIVVIDMAFLPLAALAFAHPVWRVRQWNNFFFVPLLLVYALGNLLVHLNLLGVSSLPAGVGLRLGLGMVLLLLAVMGGRVIGFFIERGVPGAVVRRQGWVERLAAPSIVVFVAAQAAGLAGWALASISLFVALVHGLRLAGWHVPGLWRVPLLWVLYLGYGWLVAGFVLQAVASLGILPASLALHAFTAGAIGAMTLGMMARVSLGHTGRPMQVGKGISLAFALVLAAGLIRVGLPALSPSGTALAWSVSAGLWLAAFILFVIHYLPVLLRARVDGRPG